MLVSFIVYRHGREPTEGDVQGIPVHNPGPTIQNPGNRALCH
jgi:hypothetical protein